MPAVPPFAIPPTFTACAGRSAGWAAWIDALPGLVGDMVEEWDLEYDGQPAHGFVALVVPVRTIAGRPAMLKVTWPHDEAEHEHLALQAWRGDGTVALIRADPRRFALLLERLHAGEDLCSVRDIEACEIVAGFYSRLHVRALPQLRLLSTAIDRWTTALATLPAAAAMPRRLVDQAVSLGRLFASDRACDGTMIHGDLHYFNVLAADREPWLVIDPKPMSGDRHYEVAPLLWNRWDGIVGSGNVRDAVRRRFHTVVDAAGLDEERARDWVIVRQMHNAMGTVQEANGRLTEGDRAELTRCIAIAKAVQG